MISALLVSVTEHRLAAPISEVESHISNVISSIYADSTTGPELLNIFCHLIEYYLIKLLPKGPDEQNPLCCRGEGNVKMLSFIEFYFKSYVTSGNGKKRKYCMSRDKISQHPRCPNSLRF